MKARTVAGLVLLAAAYALLIPGVTRTVITVEGTLEKSDVVELGRKMIADDGDISEMMSRMVTSFIQGLDLDGQIPVYHQERSIWSTVQALFRSGDVLVGMLIMLFSVIIPAVKGVLLLMVTTVRDRMTKKVSMAVSGAISKWSMADVFVVALFVAYLAANSSEYQNELVVFQARFGPGFYCFLAYCVLSIASAQLLRVRETS